MQLSESGGTEYAIEMWINIGKQLEILGIGTHTLPEMFG
jgi:hypothetical protein